MSFQPYGSDAVFTLHEAGGTESLTLRNGQQIDPFYFYGTSSGGEDREYISLSGDLCHAMRHEGVYDEGIQWAEMTLVRFGFKTAHAELGDIVVSIDATRSTSRAYLCSLSPTSRFPVLHRSRFHITATASNLPGVILQNQGVPLYLESDELDVWPPADAIYRFKFQLPLERRDNPGEVLATLNPGAFRVRPAT